MLTDKQTKSATNRHCWKKYDPHYAMLQVVNSLIKNHQHCDYNTDWLDNWQYHAAYTPVNAPQHIGPLQWSMLHTPQWTHLSTLDLCNEACCIHPSERTSAHWTFAMKPLFCSSSQLASYSFGPMRKLRSQILSSSRTSVAVRPSFVWAWTDDSTRRNILAGTYCTSAVHNTATQWTSAVHNTAIY